MLLQRLREYAIERMDLPPKLYAEAAVRYVVELSETGDLLSREPIDLADPSTPRTRRGIRRPMPQVVKTSGIVPLLFADNSEYTFGLARSASSQARVDSCHQAYLDLVRRCAEETQSPLAQAVWSFLDGEQKALLRLPDDFDRGSAVTFRIDSRFVVDEPAVQAFWAEEHDKSAAGAPLMQCLVCGREKPVLDRLQARVKGIPGGQTSGTSIISANSKAFESYGLEESLIAPTCSDCGEQFTLALNDLLSQQETSLRLGGAAAFVFWTKEVTGFNLASFLTQPESEQVRALLESVRTGGVTANTATVDATAFYATVLSGSGGRAVVREWIDTTVGGVKRNLARWFAFQRVVDLTGEYARPLGIAALAGATVRDLRDVPRPTYRTLLRSAIQGTPLPLDLLGTAVRRTHAEQRVTRTHAALIKLVLLSQDPTSHPETYMTGLEPDHSSTAYHCGRLLAVLEQVQRAALPGVNATIVDRYFGSASTAPASVFPRLVRGAQPHLSRLERDHRGAYVALQHRLEDIQDHIPGATSFPRVLSLEDQGLFTLGYYHQRAYDRARAAQAAAQRRAAGSPVDTDETIPEE